MEKLVTDCYLYADIVMAMNIRQVIVLANETFGGIKILLK